MDFVIIPQLICDDFERDLAFLKEKVFLKLIF
jgi:hypothetical protein